MSLSLDLLITNGNIVDGTGKLDDVDSYYDAVNGAGAEIANKLGDRPEVAVRSNEGHRITFAQKLP